VKKSSRSKRGRKRALEKRRDQRDRGISESTSPMAERVAERFDDSSVVEKMPVAVPQSVPGRRCLLQKLLKLSTGRVFFLS